MYSGLPGRPAPPSAKHLGLNEAHLIQLNVLPGMKPPMNTTRTPVLLRNSVQ